MARIKHNRVKNWLLFNNTGYLSIPITLSATGFNMAFFARKNRNIANARLCDTQGAGPADGFSILEQASGASAYNFRNGASATANQLGKVYNHGDIVHYVITYDGTVSKIYENGVLVGTDSSSVMSVPAATVSIGRRTGGGNPWLGKLGELVIHNTNTPWTQSEITDLYTAGKIPSGASYWLFASNVLDGSGNGNNGTLTGGSYISTDVKRSVASNRSTPQINFESNPGTLFEDFESLTGWSKGANGAYEIATTPVKNSSGSLKFTVNAGAANEYFEKTINANMLNAGNMYFWVYVPNASYFASSWLVMYLSSVSNFSKFFSTTYASKLHVGWNKIVIGRNEWSNSGGEDWANTMIRLRWRVYADGVNAQTLYFDKMKTNYVSRPKIALNFDDNWESQYTEGYTYMATKGLKGTVYVISDTVDGAGRMTSSNLATLYAAGWDLGNHTKTHPNLSTLSDADALVELNTCRDFLEARGYTRASRYVAYPGGAYDTETLALMEANGYVTGRTIIGRNQANEIDERNLITCYSLTNSSALATVKGYVDLAIKQGSLAVINFHFLVTSPTISTEWSIADFQALIDYIKLKKDQGLIDVVTMSEWYNGLSSIRRAAVSRTAV